MSKYNVTMQVLVNVRIPGIEAESQREALEKADQVVGSEQADATLRRLFDWANPVEGIEVTEYTGEAESYLVDEEGDTEFEQSQWYESNHKPLC